MSDQSDALVAKLSSISQIPRDDIAPLNIPFDRYAGEARFLYKWCRADTDALVGRGLDRSLVEDSRSECRR